MDSFVARLRNRLRAAGLRPTRQRLALGQLLFAGDNRHVSAERLHKEAKAADIHVSLPTVYNTLRQFTEAGLLREVVVDPKRCYFDTNTERHHHLFYEDEDRLEDISDADIAVSRLPRLPAGMSVKRIDVVIRVARTDH